MNRSLQKVWILAVIFIAGCASTPYTQRRQLMFLSVEDENKMGEDAYKDTLSKSKISADVAATAMLQRVGKRISAVAERSDYQWQFTLIDDPKTQNAFCLPGGKVAFYSGLLPLTKDENGMAVVLSHEVSHALARHGGERISRQMAASGAASLLQNQSQLTQQAVAAAYGIGFQLPFSRSQEAEADHIGLILMAKAGYNPETAVPFWQRMQSAGGAGGTPEFLSDHPSDANRVQAIQSEMPEALQYYKK